MLLFDAHLDLAMNAMEWNRDLTQPVDQIRKREEGMTDKPDRGKNTLSLPEMRRANIGICVTTLIARYVKGENPLPGWNSPYQAWAQTQGQLTWYHVMEELGLLRKLTNKDELKNHLTQWNLDRKSTPIGYILSIEGADSLFNMQYVEKAVENGVRAIGPAHYGPATYAHGTNSDGGIGEKGITLLKTMENLNIILDVTHLSDQSFWEALDVYGGPVWASHSNSRAITPHQRQLNDKQIKSLIERNAVIGAVFDAWMMIPNWVRGKSTPADTGLKIENIINHIDHICQIAGNSMHCGIGSDLDGGFGNEQTPQDLNKISDLQNLPDLLNLKGYSDADIENIMHKNWINFLYRVWQ